MVSRLIPESKPHRVLPFGAMMDAIKTLFGIVSSTSLTYIWLVYNIFSVIGIGFLTHSSTKPHRILHNNRSYQDFAWDCLSTSFTYICLGYSICCVIGISFQTLIPESNCIGSCFFWNCSQTLLTYIWFRSWPTFFQSHWFADFYSLLEPASWDWVRPNIYNREEGHS